MLTKHWVDISSKLLIPILIFGGGIAYTIHKDTVDRERQSADSKAAAMRQQWERDSGYIKILASTNPKEREFGLKIITILQKEGKFSEDLTPIVQAAADAGRPSDPSVQSARLILSKVPATSDSTSALTQVFIQIGREEQRAAALELQSRLREHGFATPDIELVPHPSFLTDVRYFSKDRKSQAEQVKNIIADLNFASVVRDLTAGQQQPNEALEVWFGAHEPGLLKGKTN